MRPRRTASVLLLGGLALLAACGAPSPSGPGAPDATVIRGVIVLPGRAGTATFTSGPSGAQVAVLSAEVEASGHYTLNLPPVLPALDGGASGLPASLWHSGTRLACQGRPVLSDAAAHLLVVDGGFYSVGGRRVGELLPQASALGNETGTLSTLKLLVYADRPAAVQGDLHCTEEGAPGAGKAVKVTLDYRFGRGWNTAVLREERETSSGEVRLWATAEAPQATTWKFLPTSP